MPDPAKALGKATHIGSGPKVDEFMHAHPWLNAAVSMFTGGAHDPDQQIGPADVLQAIMPLGSPLRLAENRTVALAKLQAQAEKMGLPFAEATAKMSARYPRMMSHYSDLSEVPKEFQALPMLGGNRVQEMFGQVPRMSMELHPALPDAAAVEGTMRHEATHGAQALRATDRARSATTRIMSVVPPSSPSAMETLEALQREPWYGKPMQATYNYNEKLAGGYHMNPMEVRARTATAGQNIPYGPRRADTAFTEALTGTAERKLSDVVKQNPNFRHPAVEALKAK